MLLSPDTFNGSRTIAPEENCPTTLKLMLNLIAYISMMAINEKVGYSRNEASY